MTTMNTKPKPTGRPTEAPATEIVQLRATPERKRRWTRVASLAELNLSQWVTRTCDGEADRAEAAK